MESDRKTKVVKVHRTEYKIIWINSSFSDSFILFWFHLNVIHLPTWKPSTEMNVEVLIAFGANLGRGWSTNCIVNERGIGPNNNRISFSSSAQALSQENLYRARTNEKLVWNDCEMIFRKQIFLRARTLTDADWRNSKPLDGKWFCARVFCSLLISRGEVETAFYANESKSNLHVDDERMSDFQQNVLFTFNMLCLLLLYNINNWQNFDCIVRWLFTFLLAQCYDNSPECASSWKNIFFGVRFDFMVRFGLGADSTPSSMNQKIGLKLELTIICHLMRREIHVLLRPPRNVLNSRRFERDSHTPIKFYL